MPEVIATTALYDALLKEDYVQDEIESAINKETVFKKKLTRKQTTHGRRALYAVQLATSQGNGSRAELAPLPQSDAATYQDAIVNTFNHYATFKVSGQAFVLARQAREQRRCQCQRQPGGETRSACRRGTTRD